MPNLRIPAFQDWSLRMQNPHVNAQRAQLAVPGTEPHRRRMTQSDVSVPTFPHPDISFLRTAVPENVGGAFVVQFRAIRVLAGVILLLMNERPRTGEQGRWTSSSMDSGDKDPFHFNNIFSSSPTKREAYASDDSPSRALSFCILQEI